MPSNKTRGPVVVVGASMGGIEAVGSLLRALPAQLGAAVCVVLHRPREVPNDQLVSLWSKGCLLKVDWARDGAPLLPDCVYVCPANLHLSLDAGTMRCTRGPRENGVRPSIDVLFRSAGAEYGSDAIAVVLTGTLHDGSAGAADLQSCGGRLIVQDPSDAAFGEMPHNVLRGVAANKVLSLDEIPAAIVELVNAVPANRRPPNELCTRLKLEVLVARGDTAALHENQKERPLVPFSCPECGGPMWQMNEDGKDEARYRCHTGHSFTALALDGSQSRAVENSLYAALRVLEERAHLLQDLSHRSSGVSVSESFLEKAEEAEEQAANIRKLLLSFSKNS